MCEEGLKKEVSCTAHCCRLSPFAVMACRSCLLRPTCSCTVRLLKGHGNSKNLGLINNAVRGLLGWVVTPSYTPAKPREEKRAPRKRRRRWHWFKLSYLRPSSRPHLKPKNTLGNHNLEL